MLLGILAWIKLLGLMVLLLSFGNSLEVCEGGSDGFL